MEDCIVFSSKENLEQLIAFCKINFKKKYNIDCAIDCKEKELTIKKIFLPYISEILSEYYIKDYVFSVADELFSYEYEEYYDLFIDVSQKLKNFNILQIRQRLASKISYFAKRYKKINLDSFGTFGLNEYKNELENITKNIVAEICAEEDVDYFIDNLKEYVNVEPAEFGELNILVSAENSYTYYDKNKNDITNEIMNEFYTEFLDYNAKPNDILLSSLIMKLPEKIVIHGNINERNKELFTLLKEVFGKRMVFCRRIYCTFCRM